jgi:hypothetical protein
MAAGRQIDDLIATLEQSVEAGLAYFQGPGGQSKVMIGHWGPREVLCHLVWWHQATVEGMESVAKGGAPYCIYASVDEMNARAVGRMAGRDVNQSGTYGPSLVDLARQWQARWYRQRVPYQIRTQQSSLWVMAAGVLSSSASRLSHSTGTNTSQNCRRLVQRSQSLCSWLAGAPGSCLTGGIAPTAAL